MYDCPTPLPIPNYFHFSLGAIIKLPPNPGVDVLYTDLVCTEQDRANISELVSSLAENSKFSILLKQDHFKNIGSQINHVHPLKFLAVALSTDFLKSCLIQIFDDYFKRNGFMDGLGQSLTREAEKKKLDLYLPSFSEEIGVPADSMQPYIHSHDWEGLLAFLMHI